MRLRSIFIYGIILKIVVRKMFWSFVKNDAHINFNKQKMRKRGHQSCPHNQMYIISSICVNVNVCLFIKNVLLYFLLDMSQFGLGTANSHWGYSSANYSPYLTSGGLSTCGTTSASQFNNPALGFSCTATDQASTQDFTNNARECLPSKLLLVS